MRYALIALPLVALSAPVAAQNLVGPTHTGNADAGMYGIPPTPVSPFLAPQRVRAGDAPMERLVSNEVVLDRKGYRIGKIETVAADGVVIHADWQSGYGRLVKIQHEFGIETRYAHMSRIAVKKGQRVSRGERIGDMGNSGRSTGPHLHYEVRVGGKAVNPMTYIKAGRDVF